jgi:rRNA maturation endonuclease Nob1
MEKTAINGRFKAERYGMIYCPDCKGSGKSFNKVKESEVCKVCGGFGLIKEDENSNFQNPKVKR